MSGLYLFFLCSVSVVCVCMDVCVRVCAMCVCETLWGVLILNFLSATKQSCWCDTADVLQILVH